MLIKSDFAHVYIMSLQIKNGRIFMIKKRILSCVLAVAIILTTCFNFQGGFNNAIENVEAATTMVSRIPKSALKWNGHYYVCFNNCETWEDAEKYCESLGGHLATITSASENMAVFNYIKQQGYQNAYFGLTDNKVEGQFYWITGENVNYVNWHEGEPNADVEEEDYAMFFYGYTDGTWNDGDFGNNTEYGDKTYICEWDSYNAGQSSLEKLVPADALKWNGHCYAIYNNCDTWEQAELYCESLGGHLATITSKNENTQVYQYIVSKGCENAYFGLTDNKVEGQFYWVTGEKVNYLNWHEGEPNAEVEEEDYAMFYYKYTDGKWNDGDFGDSTVYGEKNFICEWDMGDDSSQSKNYFGRDLIDRVSEYTSDAEVKQYKEILAGNDSEEIKYQKLYEFFILNGFTNVREGTEFLTKTTDKRYAYLFLTNNDIYCATNFTNWLDHTSEGAATRGLLVADGLIFNNEVGEWVNLSNYLSANYPGIKKYKEMLYNFMQDTADSNEIISSIQMVTDITKNASSAGKLYAGDLIDKMNKCSSVGELDSLMKKNETKGVFSELASSTDKDGNLKFNFSLDESSGFGQYFKAVGLAGKTMKFVNIGYDTLMDIMQMNQKLTVYSRYKEFLQSIVDEKAYLPIQLRAAAYQILQEIDDQVGAEIKKVVLALYNQTSINDTVLSGIMGKAGYTKMKTWLAVISITAFCINKIANVGEMVKQEAYVEAYSYLSSAFVKRLEASKERFKKNKTEENAWDFYYNYNMLYKLRYKGEQAYLKFQKVKGISEIFTDYGYAKKEKVVNEVLDALESKCMFNYGVVNTINYTKTYKMKMVVACPVDITVYDSKGQKVAVLKDKVVSDTKNQYGRFAVIYNAYLNEYQKILCFSKQDNCKIEIKGNKDGLVSLQMAKSKGNSYILQNYPIKKNGIISTSYNSLTNDKKIMIDNDGDGKIEKKERLQVENKKHVAVKSISLSLKKLTILKGDSKLLEVNITPIKGTNKKVRWISNNPSVVTVTDGRVLARSVGKAVIYCVALDNTDRIAKCSIMVTQPAKKGQKLRDKKGTTYKVTKSQGKISTVEYVKPYKTAKGTVQIPNTVTIAGVKYSVKTIAKNAFKNNKKVTTIVLGKNITTIGEKAFAGCSKLKKVVIEKNVSKINKQAFYKCKSLKTIIIKSRKLKTQKVGRKAFSGIVKKAVFKVPSDKINTYKKIFKSKGASNKIVVKRN